MRGIIRRSIGKIITLRSLGLIAALLSASIVQAATVNFSSAGVAESISDLIVGGDAYNVTFIGNVSSTDWSSQFDFTNSTDAFAAASAVAGALNDAGATSMLMMAYSGPSSETFSRVYYEASATDISGISMRFSAGNWIAGDLNGTFTLGTTFYPFVLDFEAVSVPLPSGVWLFFSALGLLRWLRNKRV